MLEAFSDLLAGDFDWGTLWDCLVALLPFCLLGNTDADDSGDDYNADAATEAFRQDQMRQDSENMVRQYGGLVSASGAWIPPEDVAEYELMNALTQGTGAFAPIDYEGIVEASAAATREQMILANEYAREEALRNLSLLDPGAGGDEPWEMSSRLLESAMEDAATADDYMRQAMRRDVDAILGPGGLDRLMQQVGDAQADVVDVVNQFLPAMRETVASYLQGEIPGDVTEQVLMRAGEGALRQFGRTEGPASEGLVARDLGLTSLDLMNQGMQMASGVAAFGALPIQAAADVTNVLSAYRTPLTNPTAVQQNYMNLAMGYGAINPNTTLQVAGNVAASNLGAAVNVATTNLESAYAGATSMLNYTADKYAADMTLQAGRAAANATERAGMWQGLGNIAGELLGGTGGNVVSSVLEKLF